MAILPSWISKRAPRKHPRPQKQKNLDNKFQKYYDSIDDRLDRIIIDHNTAVYDYCINPYNDLENIMDHIDDAVNDGWLI